MLMIAFRFPTIMCHFLLSTSSRFGRNIKIIHFIGPVKPWHHRYLREVDTVIISPGTYSSQNIAQDFIRRWWHVYLSTEQVCHVLNNSQLRRNQFYLC